jgi:outer membrane biosynthesis protein TonB
MRKLLLAFPILGLLVLAAGCSVPLKAKAPVERPPLDVPPPPPRVIEPAPVPEAPPEPVPELPPAPTPARPSRPAASRPNTATSTEPKPEAKPETPSTETAPPPTPPPASVPQLRTPQTADGSEADKNVRATVERAKSGLNSVNFAMLSNERKKAYNDAKAFIQASEEALKQNNYALAQSLATKAETLAHELSGR